MPLSEKKTFDSVEYSIENQVSMKLIANFDYVTEVMYEFLVCFRILIRKCLEKAFTGIWTCFNHFCSFNFQNHCWDGLQQTLHCPKIKIGYIKILFLIDDICEWLHDQVKICATGVQKEIFPRMDFGPDFLFEFFFQKRNKLKKFWREGICLPNTSVATRLVRKLENYFLI